MYLLTSHHILSRYLKGIVKTIRYKKAKRPISNILLNYYVLIWLLISYNNLYSK